MKSRMVNLLASISACVTLFAATSYVALGAESGAISSAKELPAACQKAKAEFRPITEADVEKARVSLLEAVDRLDQRLTEAGDNGENWRKYLEVASLREQLERAQGPDKAVLMRVRARYNSGNEGLDLVWFLDVQKGLQNYLAMMGAVNNPKIRTEFENRLDKLYASLQAYVVKPTTEDALVISESVRFLEDAQQVPSLVEAIQQQFVRPNLFGKISPSIVGAGIAERVDDTTAIDDCILGTEIHGTAHTVGETSVELSPDPNVGVMDTLFSGTTTSENVGYHGPVTIYSSATTSLSARKRIWVTPEGLSSYPSVASATTAVQICDIQSNKDRAIVERMAWKRAGKQQGEAESIASQHAEERLNERIDQQAAESLDKANQSYVDKFYRPFNERKLFPQLLQFSTTEQAICVLGLQAGGGKLAAPSTPPPVIEDAEMSVCVHESMANNLAFDALAGRTVYEEKVQAAVTDTLGHLPEKMKGDEDGRPWAISFAPRQPISVTFADDGFKITIRGIRFCKGDEVHKDAMNISAAYKIEKSASGFKAVRQGDIQVFPPDFAPGKQVGGRQQVIRKLLEKRFAKIFEPEILGEGLELPGKWEAAGKLVPIQVICRDGWLVIGWKRSSAEPKVASAK